ncbi:hypothetical protein H109_03800 [Trichophyton interdigitale MR816]|uniref:Uncharacterized protein n=1 Tax=Trichophyton interdigitale (strain MR816) TaxID=1215338 RepID=A0A059J977_TRIIM|nr:hypothetical protein H109_03800 [Trichophyton interdigitale MR816]
MAAKGLIVKHPVSSCSKSGSSRAGVLVVLSNRCSGRPGSQFRTAVKRPGTSSISTSSQSCRWNESFHSPHPTYHSLITLDRLTPSVMSSQAPVGQCKGGRRVLTKGGHGNPGLREDVRGGHVEYFACRLCCQA